MCSKAVLLATLVATLMLSCITAKMTAEEYRVGREQLINKDIEATYGQYESNGTTNEHKFYRILLSMFLKTGAPKDIKEIHDLEKTELFKVIRRMPKSAVHRVHFTGAVGPEYILAQLTEKDLYQLSRKNTLGKGKDIEHMDVEDFRFAQSIDKLPEVKSNDFEWVSVARAIETFGLKNYEDYIRSKITMYHPKNKNNVTFKTSEEAIEKFNSTHVRGGILRHEPQWRGLMQEIIKSLIDDNIMYAEIHSTCANVCQTIYPIE